MKKFLILIALVSFLIFLATANAGLIVEGPINLQVIGKKGGNFTIDEYKFSRNQRSHPTQPRLTPKGIVTLQGETDNQAQKDLTTEYAKDVDGVKGVKNEMVVSTPSKSTQATGDKIDDVSITGLAKMTLLIHRSTSALNTSVTTKNGLVTLTGKAKNTAEKELATKYVNGVKGVKNLMTID